jgi:hypothetical protein
MSGLRWPRVLTRPTTIRATVLVVGAGFGFPQIGLAQVPDEVLSVFYQAPEGCPSEADYRRALTSRMLVQVPASLHEATRAKSAVKV